MIAVLFCIFISSKWIGRAQWSLLSLPFSHPTVNFASFSFVLSAGTQRFIATAAPVGGDCVVWLFTSRNGDVRLASTRKEGKGWWFFVAILLFPQRLFSVDTSLRLQTEHSMRVKTTLQQNHANETNGADFSRCSLLHILRVHVSPSVRSETRNDWQFRTV